MTNVLWGVFAIVLAIDGFLNFNLKPNLGQLIMTGQSAEVRRIGSTLFYVLMVALCIYLGWFAE